MNHYAVPIYEIRLVYTDTLEVQGERPKVIGPEAAAHIATTYLKGVDREHFIILMLGATGQLIGLNPVSVGSLTTVSVEGREVFKPAIQANAAMIIAVHNHPSGDVSHTDADVELVKRLAYAGDMLGIPLLDHIIVNDQGEYESAAVTGLLD